jgi:hypothetical protein
VTINGRRREPFGSSSCSELNNERRRYVQQVSQHVDKCGPIHGKSRLMPYLAQLAQDADLRRRGEASKKVRLQF